jgi:hypothetical protein
MAVTEQMKITVGADVSQAVNNMKKATAEVNKFAATTVGASKRSNQALLDLSRVAQDSAYVTTAGFGAIANNLNPLLESFQRLKAETGSTKSAFKALASGLMGAGGIGLAVGVVSSLLVVFGDRLFAAGNNTKKAKDEARKYQEALEEYVDTLNDVDKAQLKGAQSAAEEATKLKVLYEATQNINIPLGKRRELVDELQKQYPKYFANIKDETILAGGAASAYRSLSEAILAAAKARAGQDAITELAKEQLTLEKQKTDNQKEQLKALRDLQKAQALLNKASDAGVVTGGSATGAGGGAFQSTDRQTTLNVAQQVYNEKLNKTADLVGKINKNLERQKEIANSITSNVVNNPDALLDPTGSIKSSIDKTRNEKGEFSFLETFLGFDPNGKLSAKQEAELLKAADNFWKKFGEFMEVPNFLSEINPVEVARKFNEEWEKGNFKLKFKAEIDFSQMPKVPEFDNSRDFERAKGKGLSRDEGIFGLPTKDQLDKALKDAEDAQKRIQDGFERTAETISGVVAPAFSGLFDAILDGEDPLKAFFDGLIQGVRRLISQLIQAAIYAAALSLISGGSTSFVKGFGQALGLGGVANGGGIGGGFGTAGMMNRTAGGIGQRGLSVQVTGSLVGQGSTLRAVVNNANTFSGIIR